MLLLAIDSSTRQASVALCAEDELYGEYTWLVGNNHSVELLLQIQRLLADCHLTMRDIEALAVALGPGSFNGLRVAAATARTLAFSLGRPLLGIGTLDVIAAQQGRWPGPICAVLEAGRAEVYGACYVVEEQRDEGGLLLQHLRRLGDYVLMTPEQLAAYLKEQAEGALAVPGQRALPPVLFCGEMKPTTREALRALLPDSSLSDHLHATRHASVLAKLAFSRLQRGEWDDPLRLEPLYLRRPAITASARKQPLLGGRGQPSSIHQSETEREEGALRH